MSIACFPGPCPCTHAVDAHVYGHDAHSQPCRNHMKKILPFISTILKVLWSCPFNSDSPSIEIVGFYANDSIDGLHSYVNRGTVLHARRTLETQFRASYLLSNPSVFFTVSISPFLPRLQFETLEWTSKVGHHKKNRKLPMLLVPVWKWWIKSPRVFILSALFYTRMCSS